MDEMIQSFSQINLGESANTSTEVNRFFSVKMRERGVNEIKWRCYSGERESAAVGTLCMCPE